ncbi:hypothetical protein BD310DRAFT_936131 [Dichomitus squalens]|uniref:Uncharacterized protein n=1 Tax=Dichomitus squalens TaxID=114155 RepID=A0A4Q9PJS2_9APHY|nr:hypothetical protein BD310DRAFT_936131 [Dichomitus squalens]
MEGPTRTSPLRYYGVVSVRNLLFSLLRRRRRPIGICTVSTDLFAGLGMATATSMYALSASLYDKEVATKRTSISDTRPDANPVYQRTRPPRTSVTPCFDCGSSNLG